MRTGCWLVDLPWQDPIQIVLVLSHKMSVLGAQSPLDLLHMFLIPCQNGRENSQNFCLFYTFFYDIECHSVDLHRTKAHNNGRLAMICNENKIWHKFKIENVTKTSKLHRHVPCC